MVMVGVSSRINISNSQEQKPYIYSSGVDANGDAVILPAMIGANRYSIWYGSKHFTISHL